MRADILILPGVGSFKTAMKFVEKTGIDQSIKEAVLVKRRNILGICLGMQLFCEYGNEDGGYNGLGIIKAEVSNFNVINSGIKVPHVGFSEVQFNSNSLLHNGLKSGSDYYFLHSFRILSHELPGNVGKCFYGEEFLASYEYENIYATQFHPEKSQTNGLTLLNNFLKAQ